MFFPTILYYVIVSTKRGGVTVYSQKGIRSCGPYLFADETDCHIMIIGVRYRVMKDKFRMNFNFFDDDVTPSMQVAMASVNLISGAN